MLKTTLKRSRGFPESKSTLRRASSHSAIASLHDKQPIFTKRGDKKIRNITFRTSVEQRIILGPAEIDHIFENTAISVPVDTQSSLQTSHLVSDMVDDFAFIHEEYRNTHRRNSVRENSLTTMDLPPVLLKDPDETEPLAKEGIPLYRAGAHGLFGVITGIYWFFKLAALFARRVTGV